MAKTELFELIQSMSMSEKRFFKVFSSRHVIGGENDYVKLFDLIEGMTDFDEDLVRSANFVKNSSAEKNYLYRLILKSLNAFHAQGSVKTKIYDQLTSIEILFQKGLYGQAMSLVKKAKKLAAENELFRQELLLSEIEQELNLKDQNYDGALSLMEDEGRLFDLTYNLRELMILTTKGYHVNLTKGVSRKEDDLKAFENIINSPLVKSKQKAISERARLHQISAQLTYNMVAGDNKKVGELVNEILIQYESFPHLIDYTPIGYVSSLFILGNTQLGNASYVDLGDTVKRLKFAFIRNEVLKSQKAKALAFLYQHVLELQRLNLINDPRRGYELIAEIEKELQTLMPFIGKPQLYDLYFQLALTSFYSGDYKRALRYTNEILNDLKFKSREDFMSTVKLFNLVVHFELGNDFTLEYLSKSTFNYFKKSNRLYKVEKALVKYFEKYDIYRSKGVLLEENAKLKLHLESCKQDKFEQKAFQYFDYLKWFDAKSNNTFNAF